MKRLLICSPCHALRGGVESIINDLCLHLPRRGWEPLLALGRGARFNDVERYRQVYPHHPVVAVDGTGGTRQARISSLVEVVERTRPQVVMNARLFDTYPAMAALKGKGWTGRFVATVRVMEPEYLHDAGRYRDIIDLCIVSGRVIAAAAERFSGIPGHRLVSIPGGVHPPLVPPSPRQQTPVLRLGYVGRITDHAKRIFDLVELLTLLEREGIGFRLVVAGTGADEEPLRERLEGWVRRGLVTFLGWVERQRLYEEVYPQLDCLVHFAEIEGVTIAPREAMVHGVVPVIARFFGLRGEGQFLHDVNALTFPVGDVAAAVAHLRRLATEPGLITRLSAAAITSQSGIYGLEGNMDAWAQALDRCRELPPRQGEVPPLDCSSPGRLSRLGIPPGLAQRLRNLAGRRPVPGDPGSEWPHCSGKLPPETAAEMLRFVREREEAGDPLPPYLPEGLLP